MKKIILALLLATLNAPTAFADVFSVCDVRAGNEMNTDLIMVRSCESRTSQVGCPGTGWVYWRVADPYSKEMFTLAVTALTTGKKIQVGYKGSGQCAGNHDWANMVNLNEMHRLATR